MDTTNPKAVTRLHCVDRTHPFETVIFFLEGTWFEGKCAGWVSQGGRFPAAGADFRALVHIHGEKRYHQERRRRLLTIQDSGFRVEDSGFRVED